MPSRGVVGGALRATDRRVPSPPRTMTRSASRDTRFLGTPSGLARASAVASSKKALRPRRRTAAARELASRTAEEEVVLATMATRENLVVEPRDPFIRL